MPTTGAEESASEIGTGARSHIGEPLASVFFSILINDLYLGGSGSHFQRVILRMEKIGEGVSDVSMDYRSLKIMSLSLFQARHLGYLIRLVEGTDGLSSRLVFHVVKTGPWPPPKFTTTGTLTPMNIMAISVI
jgi:hypothetical protein